MPTKEIVEIPVPETVVATMVDNDEESLSTATEEDGDDSTFAPAMVSPEKKRQNTARSQSRSRSIPLLNRKKPRTAAKSAVSPSEDDVKAFCNRHVDAMKNGHRTEHYVRALMTCTISKKATVWETWCTPFFFACICLDLSIFDWIQTGMNSEAVCIVQTDVEACGYDVPRIPHLGKHMSRLFKDEVYPLIKTEWEGFYNELVAEYSMMGKDVVSIPPCPTEEELLAIFQFVRKFIYRIWITWPNAFKEDKRQEVLDCLVAELKDIQSIRAFKQKVDQIVDRNLAKMMELDGKTDLERYQELTANHPRKPSPRKKSQGTKRKEGDLPQTKDSASPNAANRRSDRIRETTIRDKASPSNMDETPKPSPKETTKETTTDETPKASPDLEKSIAVDEHIKALVSVIAECGDKGTKELMMLWKQECIKEGRKDLYVFALSGCVKALTGASMASVYLDHHASTLLPQAAEFQPPNPVRGSKDNIVDYSTPGHMYSQVAQDCFHIMHVLLVSLVMHGEAPPRWFWETMLLQELRRIGPVTQDERDLAMLIALVESSVSMDRGCIGAVVNLKKAELLSLEALRDADPARITACVEKCGLGNKCTLFLKSIANEILTVHGGRIPCTFEGLSKLVGIGPKAANVILNELFGNVHSIAVDRHVHDVAIALGFHIIPHWRKTDVDHVETSLRTWVGVGDYRLFNPVLGGFAQVFTAEFRTIGKEKIDRARVIVTALGDHIHRPYHVELLWYALVRVRNYYLVEKKELPARELLKPPASKPKAGKK